jgi:glycosyltransferase involved in cell wall biosynthesis
LSDHRVTHTVVLSANTSWYLANFRASTIRSLQECGYRVVCIAPEDEYTDQLIGLGCDWRPLFMDNAGSNPVKELGLLIRFIRYYREIAPAVVLHFTIKNNVYGTWAASLLGIPALNNVSGLGTAFIRDGMVPKVVRALYRLSQPLATLVFCQNSEDMELLVANGLVPEGRLRKIPGSGVDLGRFQPRNRDSSGGIRFLFAGRMLEDKGLRELMEAMRALSHEYPRRNCGSAGSRTWRTYQQSRWSRSGDGVKSPMYFGWVRRSGSKMCWHRSTAWFCHRIAKVCPGLYWKRALWVCPLLPRTSPVVAKWSAMAPTDYSASPAVRTLCLMP